MPTDHLREHQFKKGVSGNPGGRKKGVSVKERITAFLTMNAEDLAEVAHSKHQPAVDRMAAAYVLSAIDAGSGFEGQEKDMELLRKYIHDIANRIDGLPTQYTEAIVTPVDLVTLEDRRKSKEIGDGGDA